MCWVEIWVAMFDVGTGAGKGVQFGHKRASRGYLCIASVCLLTEIRGLQKDAFALVVFVVRGRTR